MTPNTPRRFEGARRWLSLPGHWQPKTLSEATLRELCAFRVSIMGLRPETDPEQDYLAFRQTLRRCEFVWVDEVGGELAGMYAVVLRTLEHEGAQFAIWEGEYACVSPHHRKGWKIVLSVATSLAYMRLRHRRHRPYIFGAAYLPSFLLLHRVGAVYLHDDPAMSASERSLMARLSSEYRGWDPTTGTIVLPTRPIQPRTTPPSEPSLRQPWERYLARNPRWYEGRANAVLKPISGLGAAIARETVRLSSRRFFASRRRRDAA
ncbi:MAG: hypothetical protein Q8L48_40065 [Archangium sp.]|nr:hypothetical protein [Archangium sp.]